MRFRRFGLAGLVVSIALAGGDDYGAGDIWNNLKGKIGNKEGIKERLDRPLNEEVPMRDFSDRISFSGRIRCPSKKEGVQVLFIPLGGGDHRLVIKEDLNLDGNYEYVYDTSSAGVRVSGVCRSGIVSCDPGSWKNCKYYLWTGNNGYVSLQPVQDTSLLGGCFCSNSSCGANILTQQAVNTIAGGISQAVMNARRDLGVSKSGFDFNTFTLNLRIQQTEGCASADGGYGEKDIERLSSYYETQTEPSGWDYVLSNPGVQTDPDSPYKIVQDLNKAKVNGTSLEMPAIVACDIRKNVYIRTVDKFDTCSPSWTDSSGRAWCEVFKIDRLYRDGREKWADLFECVYERFYPRSNLPSYYPAYFEQFRQCVLKYGASRCGAEPVISIGDDNGFLQKILTDCNIGPGVKRYAIESFSGQVSLKPYQAYAVRFKPLNTWDNWECKYLHAINKTTGEELVYKAQCSKEWDRRDVIYISSLIKNGGNFVIEGEYAGDDWGEGWTAYQFSIYKSQIYKDEEFSLSPVNTCPADTSGCSLMNEWICDRQGQKCVQTIKDGLRTSTKPKPSCYQDSSKLDRYIVCAYGDKIDIRGKQYSRTFTGQNMWFWIKREYQCSSNSVDLGLEKVQAVAGTTSYSSDTGKISYSDFSCQGGVCTRIRNDTAEVGKPDTCPVSVCTVRLSNQKDTSVFADRTNRSQTPGGSSTSPLEVRVCQERVCPVNPGEVMVEDCKCEAGFDSKGFTTTVATLQTVLDSVKDMICSTKSP